MTVEIRLAERGDLAAITEIYNDYIVDTHVSFDTEPHALTERAEWFDEHGPAGRHQALVAVEDSVVIGFSASSRWRSKAAYDTSVETTIVLRADATGKGVGPRLLTALLERLADEDVHRAYARVALPNDPSIALHGRLGYTTVGIEHDVGRKFDRYWSVQVLEYRFA